VTGFVLVDKPPGPTSHDVVDRVRRVFGLRRVGHAGTLDPPASGLLVVAVGPATRLLRYVQDLPKTYETTGALGVTTTTLDAAGEVLSRAEVNVSAEDVRRAASELCGEIDQTPPAVSAVKVDGERAYRKARRGEEVELAPRRVTVYAFEVLRTSTDAFDARIECSSGTYVRSLVAEVGERLGCGAHVAHLRRTRIGHLSVEDATQLDALAPDVLRTVDEVLAHLARVDVDGVAATLARNGRSIDVAAPEGDVLVVGPEGAVGIFESSGGVLKPATIVGLER
jgi:tRNA pseudouridine55 synthase